jgi:hypothetical protein
MIVRAWWMLVVLLGLVAPPAQAQDAVATLMESQGIVEVTLARTQRSTQGRAGLLLYERDRIRTGTDGSATILFRDGSEITLFNNTEFVIQAVQEQEAGERTFQRRLQLKFGAFWSNFFGESEATEIVTPHFQVIPQGTAFLVTVGAEFGSVLLSDGEVEVRNRVGSVRLQSGQRLRNARIFDELPQLVEAAPARLVLTAPRLDWSLPRSSVEFELRVSARGQGGRAVREPLALELRSDYEGVRFPPRARLNSRGEALIPIRVLQPQRLQRRPNLKIQAVVSDPSNLDVAGGRLVLPTGPGRREFEIDADTSQILPSE